jgi:hypothetical protein
VWGLDDSQAGEGVLTQEGKGRFRAAVAVDQDLERATPLAGEEVLNAGDDEAGSVPDADNDGQAEISGCRGRCLPRAGKETGQESDKEWVAYEGVKNEEEAYEDSQAHGVEERNGREESPGRRALFDCEQRGSKSNLAPLNQKALILSAGRVAHSIV